MRVLAHRIVLSVGVVVWLAVVVAGLAKLWRYSNASGTSGDAPSRWPVESAIGRAAGKPTLVMVAHPHCPCSRASVGELARLMAETDAPPVAYVLFVKPEGFDEDWVESDLWRSAAAIPGVTAISDDDGREARIFGAATSGQTMLYDADGALAFSGGITAARGHAGDNAGRSAIVSLLGHRAAEDASVAGDEVTAPVFGCALFAQNTVPDDTQVCSE